VIVNNALITGGSIADNITTKVPSGVIRSYDLLTGNLLWAWEPLGNPTEGSAASTEKAESGAESMPPAYQQDTAHSSDLAYQRGTTNSWSFLSVDPKLGLVYVPTGNTSPDYYGGQREGLDYYSSSVVALRIDTGEVAWHFQTVHHDIWDFDVPSQPTFFDWERGGESVLGLAQTTKQGYVFLLDRETGEPLFPVVETAVPQGAVTGDFTAPTQPIPSKPRSLFELPGDNELLWGLTPWDKGACANTLEKVRYEGPFTPPTTDGALHMPSAFGGQNWGGASNRFDQRKVNRQHAAYGDYLAVVTSRGMRT